MSWLFWPRQKWVTPQFEPWKVGQIKNLKPERVLTTICQNSTMLHHTEPKGLKFYLPLLIRLYDISINLQVNFKKQCSTFDENTLSSDHQYHLQISYSKMSSSKLIILDCFSSLFPDQMHYHSLELNENFAYIQCSLGTESIAFKAVCQWPSKN